MNILKDIWKESISQDKSMSYPPKLFPGTEGGVDIFWKGSSLELLMNVRRDPRDKITYYGHRKDGSEIEGEVEPNDLTRITDFLHYE